MSNTSTIIIEGDSVTNWDLILYTTCTIGTFVSLFFSLITSRKLKKYDYQLRKKEKIETTHDKYIIPLLFSAVELQKKIHYLLHRDKSILHINEYQKMNFYSKMKTKNIQFDTKFNKITISDFIQSIFIGNEYYSSIVNKLKENGINYIEDLFQSPEDKIYSTLDKHRDSEVISTINNLRIYMNNSDFCEQKKMDIIYPIALYFCHYEIIKTKVFKADENLNSKIIKCMEDIIISFSAKKYAYGEKNDKYFTTNCFQIPYQIQTAMGESLLEKNEQESLQITNFSTFCQKYSNKNFLKGWFICLDISIEYYNYLLENSDDKTNYSLLIEIKARLKSIYDSIDKLIKTIDPDRIYAVHTQEQYNKSLTINFMNILEFDNKFNFYRDIWKEMITDNRDNDIKISINKEKIKKI
tara:strand:+ start:80 stop:1312 length:1233 start_codon:yes stop_codon:yes gene_type:complete